MRDLRIQRPVFRGCADSAADYAAAMIGHLQDLEDWFKVRGEVECEGWGVSQMWSLEHRDGRVAKLPDVCPEYLRKASKQSWRI